MTTLRSRFIFTTGICLILAAPMACRGDEPQREFGELDTNRDQKVSQDEFLIGKKADRVAARDFRIADADDNGVMSYEEYLVVRGITNPAKRGPLPDIIAGLVEQTATTLDATFDNWDQEPQREYERGQFYETLAGQWHQLTGGGGVAGMNIMDPDNNRSVSRSEARRMIEICMGMRYSNGMLLRHTHGLVINRMLFLQSDETGDNRLDKDEFADSRLRSPTAADDFLQADENQDGFVSFEEWASLKDGILCDPVADFRRMDTNLDARLDHKELLQGTLDSERNLTKHVFPRFDWNGDGVLSLAEYRTTMLANPVLDWHAPIYDQLTEPGKLAFSDFYRDYRLGFPFLRLMYFQRLDTSGDMKLDTKEWSFRLREPDTFFTMNEDATDWKVLYQPEKRTDHSAPSVSPDGKTIAFQVEEESRQSRRIVMMPIGGGHLKYVIAGISPSWSPDGKSLLYTNTGEKPREYGTWQIELQEGNPQPRFLLERARGPVWNPDGKRIVAAADEPKLILYNTDDKTLVDVLAPVSSPYREINSNIAWSPEGHRLCFAGYKVAGIHEIALIDLSEETPQFKIRHTLKRSAAIRIAWHPKRNRVIYSTWCAARQQTQLYEFDPTNDDAPKLVAGQDPTRNNTDACWTPDGKQLIIVSGDY